MANKVIKQGRRKRMGAKSTRNLGSARPDGRSKGGSKRVGRTGIAKPPMHAGKRGEKSAPMYNAMRGSPTTMSVVNRTPSGHSKHRSAPKVLDKMYGAMRGS